MNFNLVKKINLAEVASRKVWSNLKGIVIRISCVYANLQYSKEKREDSFGNYWCCGKSQLKVDWICF